MRRIRHLPFDLWFSLLIAMLAAMGAGKLMDLAMEGQYEAYVEESQVDAGQVGGAADDATFRALSIDDMLSHDAFTIELDTIYYGNDGGGYYGSHYLSNIELASGERVAVVINGDGVQRIGDVYTTTSILPVGRIVYEDLTKNQSFLEQIEHGYKLTRTDFYVDMQGDGGHVDEETFSDQRKMPVQAAVGIVVFVLVHMAGSALGVFPRYLPARKKKEKDDCSW